MVSSLVARLSVHLLNFYMFCSGVRQLIILACLILFLRERHAASSSESAAGSARKEGPYNQFYFYRVLVLLGAHYRDFHAGAVTCAASYSYVVIFFYFGPMFYDKFKREASLFDANSSVSYDFVKQPEKYYEDIEIWSESFKTVLTESSRHFFLSDTRRCGREAEAEVVASTIDGCRLRAKNRNREWHRKLQQTWLVIHCFIIIYNFACIVSVSIQAKESYFRYKKVGTVLYRWDYWSMLEECVFTFFAAYLYSSPLIKLKLNQYDIYALLNHLTARMDQLMHLLRFSRELYCRSQDEQAPEVLKQVKLRCNKEALEVYIYFRYFTKEQAEHREFANLVVSQYLSYLACIVFTLLSVVKCIERENMMYVVVVVVSICSFVNSVFLVCSAINCKCIRAVQKAWQLLANSQQMETDARIEEQLKLKQTGNLQAVALQQLIEKRPKQTGCLCEVQENLFAHLIDAHTHFLWYKLVHDTSQVTDQFSYTTLGFYQMDYKSMIQFNFWLTSIMMATYMRDWI